MSKYVVTIAREFGSLGRTIGKKLSQELEIGYYDRELLEEAADIMNTNVKNLADYDEKLKNRLTKALYPMGLDSTLTQTKLFEVQKMKILDIADRESCVIVGRCANHILKDHKNVLKIFVYAPYDERIKNCTQELNLELEEAKRMIRSVDKARQLYHEYYTNEKYKELESYDIMINSGLLGVDGTVGLLKNLVINSF